MRDDRALKENTHNTQSYYSTPRGSGTPNSTATDSSGVEKKTNPKIIKNNYSPVRYLLQQPRGLREVKVKSALISR